MTGKEYADLIAAYITTSYQNRGLHVYREVSVGKSIIGKNRRIDVFITSKDNDRALAIECKFQAGQGTTDEKIPYALNDIAAMWMPSCIAYAGEEFSAGVVHMLQSSRYAAYCLPMADALGPTSETRELDHVIASVFHWWDIILADKNKFDLSGWSPIKES